MRGVVLAGGRSRRMGESKARVRLGGMTLLERAVENLKPLFPRVLVVSSPEESVSVPGTETIHDPVQGYGSLMGIYTGLKHTRDSIFAVACDMPFINLDLIKYMIGESKGRDVVVPKYGGHYEPLQAIYSPSCLPHIEDMIKNEERKIINFYDKVKVLTIEDDVLDRFDPERLSFVNINSPEDLARAEKILSEKE